MNNINTKVQDIKSLKEITVPINKDIHLFRKELKDSLRSEVRLINILAKYMMMRRGKHIRPFLTIFSAHICGEPTANSFRAAAMIEMLHAATLIHDDVVDETKLRRGWATLHKKWKNKLSVLMGDYILSGGEYAALAIIDACARFLPGIIGNQQSVEQDSFSNGILKGPVYTRPESFNSETVPDELLSGNHALIKEWKDNQGLIRTYKRRPELLNNIKLTKKQKKLLEELDSKDIL